MVKSTALALLLILVKAFTKIWFRIATIAQLLPGGAQLLVLSSELASTNRTVLWFPTCSCLVLVFIEKHLLLCSFRTGTTWESSKRSNTGEQRQPEAISQHSEQQ